MTGTRKDDSLIDKLKKVVDDSPKPLVTIVEEDNTSEGIWRALSLRASRTISGPYRALKISPYGNSEGLVTKESDARKMVETYLGFDEERVDLLIEETEEENDVLILFLNGISCSEIANQYKVEEKIITGLMEIIRSKLSLSE